LCGVEEDLDERETGRSLHDLRGITETEAQGKDQNEAKGGIQDDGPCDGSWQRFRSVFDLFGYA